MWTNICSCGMALPKRAALSAHPSMLVGMGVVVVCAMAATPLQTMAASS